MLLARNQTGHLPRRAELCFIQNRTVRICVVRSSATAQIICFSHLLHLVPLVLASPAHVRPCGSTFGPNSQQGPWSQTSFQGRPVVAIGASNCWAQFLLQISLVRYPSRPKVDKATELTTSLFCLDWCLPRYLAKRHSTEKRWANVILPYVVATLRRTVSLAQRTSSHTLL